MKREPEKIEINNWEMLFAVKHDATTITFRSSSQMTISEVVETFENFLKAAGYRFDGYLDFVQDDIIVAEPLPTSDTVLF